MKTIRSHSRPCRARFLPARSAAAGGARAAAIAVALLLGLPSPAPAQWQAPDRADQAAAMDRLKFLSGDWEGSGWMQMGPERSEFASSERVSYAAGGLALVVRGVHRAPLPDGTEKVVHDALGVLTWSSEDGAYRFASKLDNGFDGVYRAELTESGDLEWSIPVPGREMRYTIHVDGDRWTETGRMSTDGGETWSEFFGMTLERVGAR
ncbi:MAG TPA: hypothetical protein VKU85_12660 [bacterium]|nr:hypothetical protein [bacterium]